MKILSLHGLEICTEYIGISPQHKFYVTDGILPDGYVVIALIYPSKNRIENIRITQKITDKTLSQLLYFLLEYSGVSKGTNVERWGNDAVDLGLLLMGQGNIDFRSFSVNS